MQAFHLQRLEDVSGVSGTGRVAEGVVFSNGLVALTWLSEHPTVAVYPSLEAVEAIHGHDGRTQVVVDGGLPSASPVGGTAAGPAIGAKPRRRSRGSLAAVNIGLAGVNIGFQVPAPGRAHPAGGSKALRRDRG